MYMYMYVHVQWIVTNIWWTLQTSKTWSRSEHISLLSFLLISVSSWNQKPVLKKNCWFRTTVTRKWTQPRPWEGSAVRVSGRAWSWRSWAWCSRTRRRSTSLWSRRRLATATITQHVTTLLWKQSEKCRYSPDNRSDVVWPMLSFRPWRPLESKCLWYWRKPVAKHCIILKIFATEVSRKKIVLTFLSDLDAMT